MDYRTPEIKQIGQELHQAEAAINVGRQAMAQALAAVPPDMETYHAKREDVHQARLVRNGLRRQLEGAKGRAPLVSLAWTLQG